MLKIRDGRYDLKYDIKFDVKYAYTIVAVALATTMLAGCMTPQIASYDNDEFISGNAYSHSFAGSGTATCEAVRRALLSQGYIVTEATPALVTGNKKFQRDRNSHAQIDFSVVCAPNSEGSNATTAFANAVRQTYSLKKTSTSASVGVGVLGSLSMPVGSSDESMVKIGAETIASKKFYDQFFERVENYLDVVAPVAPVGPIKVVPSEPEETPETPELPP